MQRIVCLFVLPAIVLSAVLLVGPVEADRVKARTMYEPAVTWTGSYSAIESREFQRITTEAEWRELWQRHAGDGAERDSYDEIVVPAIDFERFMVIGYFRGKAWNTRSERLVEYVEYDTHLQMKFEGNKYQTAAIAVEPAAIEPEPVRRTARAADAADDPNYTSAYALWVVPRSMKSITIEENVQGLIGHPPKWKVQHRFDEIKPAR